MKPAAAILFLLGLGWWGAGGDAMTLEARIEAEHPSDYVRVLETDQPELWAAAVIGLLGEDDDPPELSISSIVRRVFDLPPDLQARVAQALRHHPRHPKTSKTLWRLMRPTGSAPGPEPPRSRFPRDAILALVNEDVRKEPVDALGPVQRAAAESLLVLRFEENREYFRKMILDDGPHRLEALRALVETFDESTSEDFDARYLPAVRTLFRADDAAVRQTTLTVTKRLDTPGLRKEWARLLRDPDEDLRWSARWLLVERGDPRPCPALLEHAEDVADTWSHEAARNHRIESVGAACAPFHYLDFFAGYEKAADANERYLYERLIEGATGLPLFEHPSILERLRRFADHRDPFLRATAVGVLEWHAHRAAEAADTDEKSVPLVLIGSALLSAIVGGLLFIWAFRLYQLAVRVRNRPVTNAGSLAMGPVALEGEVQPIGDYLRHPLTDEPCVYYAGADVDHPAARFYLEDGTGRVLVDPRRAVLFSDDQVLVAGERVHVVGFADRDSRDRPVVRKDDTPPPLYRRLVHGALQLLFGFGQETSVTRMLFSDPHRCFWIWDDLERRPMGEGRDVMWLAAGVLLGGAWMVVFALSVLALVDQGAMMTLLER